MGGAVGIAPGCASGGGREDPDRVQLGRLRLTPTEARIDAIIGQTLVLPVALEGPVSSRRPVAVRLDDGRWLDAGLYWIGVRFPAAPPSDPVVGAWLPGPGAWTATPASASSRPSRLGSWAVVVRLPTDAIGQGIWIERQRTPLNWIPDPAIVRWLGGERQGAGEGGTRAPPAAHPISPELERFAAPDRQSPVWRWRYLLLTSGLRDTGGPGGPALQPFEDPVIEALARQTEARWRAALDWLAVADPALAERLARRLVTTIDFGAGVVAPAYPSGQRELDRLLADLMDTSLDPVRRAQSAAAWLGSLPRAVGWVIDDAGLRDGATGSAVATVGVANLDERSTLAWAASEVGAGTPDLLPLEAFSAQPIQTVVPTRPADAGSSPLAEPAAVGIHAGAWKTVGAVAATPLSGAPPGARLGPTLPDWTMETWLAGTPLLDVVDPAWTTAALVHKSPSPGVEATDGEPSPLWSIYVECRAPEGDRGAGESAETVRVWLGPSGAPVSVLRVSSDGAVVDELAIDQGLTGPLAGARVERQPDRWTCRLPIPRGAIEPDGTLRIGFSRTDSRGLRTAWPRAMLPWQTEPGRGAVDTSAWRSLAEP